MKCKTILLQATLLFASVGTSVATISRFCGVYWGTFDPPTLAHHAIISQAFSVGIEHLYVVVNNHGHKSYCASVEDRIAMLKSSIDPRLSVTLLVQDANTTWGTQELKKAFGSYPDTLWYLFSGQENLAYWNLKECDPKDTIVIIERQGATTIIPDNVMRLMLTEIRQVVSSTVVRNALKTNKDTWHRLVSPQVASYIEKNALYTTCLPCS